MEYKVIQEGSRGDFQMEINHLAADRWSVHTVNIFEFMGGISYNAVMQRVAQ